MENYSNLEALRSVTLITICVTLVLTVNYYFINHKSTIHFLYCILFRLIDGRTTGLEVENDLVDRTGLQTKN